MKQNRVLSCLEVVTISDVRDRKARFIRRNFSDEETHVLKSAFPGTLAGLAATKMAICALAADVAHVRNLATRDIVLEYVKGRSPRLARFNRSTDGALSTLMPHILISISHTADNAYGLAVYSEDSGTITEGHR